MLRRVMDAAEDYDRVVAERDAAQAEARKWEQIAKDLGAGVGVVGIPSQRVLEIRVRLSEDVLAEMQPGARREWLVYTGYDIVKKLQRAIKGKFNE